MATGTNTQPVTRKQKVKKVAKTGAKGAVAVYAYRLKTVGANAAWNAQKDRVKKDANWVGNTRPAVGAAIYADRARSRLGQTKAGAAAGRAASSATSKVKGAKTKMRAGSEGAKAFRGAARKRVASAVKKGRSAASSANKTRKANMPGARSFKKSYGATNMGPKNKTGAARAASKAGARIKNNATKARASKLGVAAGTKAGAAKKGLSKGLRAANRKRGSVATGFRAAKRGNDFKSVSKFGRAGGVAGKVAKSVGANKGKYAAGAAGVAAVGGAATYAYKRRKAGKSIVPRRKGRK